MRKSHIHKQWGSQVVEVIFSFWLYLSTAFCCTLINSCKPHLETDRLTAARTATFTDFGRNNIHTLNWPNLLPIYHPIPFCSEVVHQVQCVSPCYLNLSIKKNKKLYWQNIYFFSAEHHPIIFFFFFFNLVAFPLSHSLLPFVLSSFVLCSSL